MPTPTSTETHIRALTLRLPDQAKAVIDRAAQIRGRSRTDFMIEASLRAAEDAILDQTVIAVDPQTFDKFVAALDRPAVANEKLRTMLRTPAPWETK